MKRKEKALVGANWRNNSHTNESWFKKIQMKTCTSPNHTVTLPYMYTSPSIKSMQHKKYKCSLPPIWNKDIHSYKYIHHHQLIYEDTQRILMQPVVNPKYRHSFSQIYQSLSIKLLQGVKNINALSNQS